MKSAFTITTQKEVREAFWDSYTDHKRRPGKTQNDYPADTRMAFCDYVEFLVSSGHISETLAQKVTL